MILSRLFSGSAALGLCALLATAPAEASPIFFFGEDLGAGGSLPVPNSAAAQASFLGNLVGVGVEDFESLSVGSQFPLNISFGADTATLTGTNTVANTGVRNSAIAGRFAISGSNYLNVGTDDAASFTMSFSTPQAALGFYATDIGDFAGTLGIRLDGAAPITVPHGSANGSALFWGIIDTANPFSTVTFVNIGGGSFSDAFGFDDFTIGRVDQVRNVPEPFTGTLLGLALLGVARGRRQRCG